MSKTNRVAVGGRNYALKTLTDSIGFLTRVVQIQIHDSLRASGALSMSPATLCALRLIDANPGIRQVDAARILLIHESNMANLVKDLIAQGLIKRDATNGGKRGGLWITADGHRQVERLASTFGIDREFASVLSDKEYRQIIDLLNRLYLASLNEDHAVDIPVLKSSSRR